MIPYNCTCPNRMIPYVPLKTLTDQHPFLCKDISDNKKKPQINGLVVRKPIFWGGSIQRRSAVSVRDRAPRPARRLHGQWAWRGCGARLARALVRVVCHAERRTGV